MTPKKTPFLTPLSLITLATAVTFASIIMAGCNGGEILVDYPGATAGEETTSTGVDSDSNAASDESTTTNGGTSTSTSDDSGRTSTTTGSSGSFTSTSTSDDSGSDSDSESSSTGTPCTRVTCEELMTRPDFFSVEDIAVSEVCDVYDGKFLNWAQAIRAAERGVQAHYCDSFSLSSWQAEEPINLLDIPAMERSYVACMEFLGQDPFPPIIDGIPEDWEEFVCAEDIHPLQDLLLELPPLQTRLPGFTDSEFHPIPTWQTVAETRISSKECFYADTYDWSYEYSGVDASLSCRLHVLNFPYNGNVQEYEVDPVTFPVGVGIQKFPLPNVCLSGYHSKLEVQCEFKQEWHIGASLSSWGIVNVPGLTVFTHNLWKSRTPISVVKN